MRLLGGPAARALALSATDGLRFNVEMPTALWVGLASGAAAYSLCPAVLLAVGYI
jgi:hypothetical protein